MNAVAILQHDEDFDLWWCDLVCHAHGTVIYRTDKYGDCHQAVHAMQVWVAWYNECHTDRWYPT